MSAFDPNSFLADTVEGASSTQLEPIPEGEYTAFVASGDKALTVRETKTGRVVMDLTWEIQDEQLKAALGREVVTVRQSIFLDMANGRIDRAKGKNVQLGRLREALGQNDPMKPWQPSNLVAAGPAKIKVSQRPDPNDDTIIYNDVKSVAKA